jgi:RNA polymerase sigma factor (sigma-70 family)
LSAIEAETNERPTDIGDLVRAAADGDASAWRELTRRYTPLLHHIARSYRLNHADSADVVQLTWLRMVENLSRLREPRAIGAWLCTTVRRESQLTGRRAQRVVPVAEFEFREEPSRLGVDVNVEEEMERRERAWRLHAAVIRLPDSDRRLLGLLMSSPPPSYREMAAKLGRPIGSIGPSRARCLARLRRELSEVGLDAPS